MNIYKVAYCKSKPECYHSYTGDILKGNSMTLASKHGSNSLSTIGAGHTRLLSWCSQKHVPRPHYVHIITLLQYTYTHNNYTVKTKR